MFRMMDDMVGNWKNAIGTMMALLAMAASPACAENLRVPFTFDWNGIPLGKASMTYSDTDATYEAALDGRSNGFGNIFHELKTTTSASGLLKDEALAVRVYDTKYQLGSKRKELHLRWNDAGKLTEERLLPPRKEQETRPLVAEAQKTGAIDPLSGFWSLRQWAGVAKPGAMRSLKVWDGKRLYELKASYDHRVTWRLSGQPIPAHLIRVRRTGLAGFKPEEQQALEAGKEPELLFYFAAGETGPVKDLEPVGMEISVLLGTIHAVRTLPMAAPVAPVESRTFQ